MVTRWIVFSGLFACLVFSTQAQSIDLAFLETRAEATDFKETSRYEEVVAFVDVLGLVSEQIHTTTFGYSSEGRALPLVVFGTAKDASPAAVRATGKLRVFVQANIHAGEVCGKEAMMMLLRALAAGQHRAWVDSLVLLVAPIYNADGNERISLTNRPGQNGPLGGMGQRPNAQGLDLNRDHMKVDSPEARSLVSLLNAYDPHVVVDLHTTNGTYHAYHLTYSPPLHPNTPAGIDTFLRETWLPTVTERIKETYGWDYYYYGNVPWRNSTAERGWYTFDHRPRFNNNYTGLRNRMAILSEAYAYASFEERVLATFYFVEEILAFSHQNAGPIQKIVAQAEAQPVVGKTLALRAQHARSEAPLEILMGQVEEVKHPYSGAMLRQRVDVTEPEQMYEYGRFAPSETETVPRAYLIPPELSTVIDRLKVHGVAYRTLANDSTLQVERFRIDSTQVAGREYQGHLGHTLFGAYEKERLTVPAGTLVVPVSQPLGRLTFSLLEPRSDDGLLAWGLVEVSGAATYPILRLAASP